VTPHPNTATCSLCCETPRGTRVAVAARALCSQRCIAMCDCNGQSHSSLAQLITNHDAGPDRRRGAAGVWREGTTRSRLGSAAPRIDEGTRASEHWQQHAAVAAAVRRRKADWAGRPTHTDAAGLKKVLHALTEDGSPIHRCGETRRCIERHHHSGLPSRVCCNIRGTRRVGTRKHTKTHHHGSRNVSAVTHSHTHARANKRTFSHMPYGSCAHKSEYALTHTHNTRCLPTYVKGTSRGTASPPSPPDTRRCRILTLSKMGSMQPLSGRCALRWDTAHNLKSTTRPQIS
jgi:hypothetical protein